MSNKIEFVDLGKQYSLLEDEIQRRIAKVLGHRKFILGPEVEELERRLAEYVGVKHAIGVANGTDALQVALLSLDVGPGDEVITTPFTFIATAETIVLIGAKPVFADIDERTFNINPELIAEKITPRTKAIIPVSLFGQCADIDEIMSLAKKHHLAVIEDGAQSFGATYKGEKSCGLTTIGCTSFFPSKPLGCYGDGGACFTRDDSLAEKMRQIRSHGQGARYQHTVIGLNSRLDTLQAAVLLAKLEAFPREVDFRQTIANRYTALLKDHVTVPTVAPHNTSVFAQYTIQIDSRDAVREKLQGQGIPTAVHYPLPLHLQPAFSFLRQEKGSFPVAEKVSHRVLSLPMHPYLEEKDQIFIAETLKKCLVNAS